MRASVYNKRGHLIEIVIGDGTTTITPTSVKIQSSGSSLSDIYSPIVSKVLTLSFLNDSNSVYQSLDDYIGKSVSVRDHKTSKLLFSGTIIEPFNNLRVVRKKEVITIVAVDELAKLQSTELTKVASISLMELTSTYLPNVTNVWVDESWRDSNNYVLLMERMQFGLGEYEWSDTSKPTVSEVLEAMMKFFCTTARIESTTLYIERPRAHGVGHYYLKLPNTATASGNVVDTNPDTTILLKDYNINASQELMSVAAHKSHKIELSLKEAEVKQGEQKWQSLYDSNNGVMLNQLLNQDVSNYDNQSTLYKWQFIQKYGYDTITDYYCYTDEVGGNLDDMTLECKVNDAIKNTTAFFNNSTLSRLSVDQASYYCGALLIARDSAEYTVINKNDTPQKPTGSPSLTEGILFFNCSNASKFTWETPVNLTRVEQNARMCERNAPDKPWAVRHVADGVFVGSGSNKMVLLISGTLKMINHLPVIDGHWQYGRNMTGCNIDSTDFPSGTQWGTPLLPIKVVYDQVKIVSGVETTEHIARWEYMSLDGGANFYKTSEKFAQTYPIRNNNEWLANYGTDGYVVEFAEGVMVRNLELWLYPPSYIYLKDDFGSYVWITHAILEGFTTTLASRSGVMEGDEVKFKWQNENDTFKGSEVSESLPVVSAVGKKLGSNNVMIRQSNGYYAIDTIKDIVYNNTQLMKPENIRCQLYGRQYAEVSRGLKAQLKGYHTQDTDVQYDALSYYGKIVSFDYDVVEDITNIDSVEIKS